MKLKIPKIFNMNEFLQKVEPNARYFMWVFGMLLATATVVSILPILTQNNRLILMVLLILFFFAGLIVYISDLRRQSISRLNRKQEGTSKTTYARHSDRNKWISIGLIILVAIATGLFFVARQLPATPQGYQAFFTAFAAIAALGTGIALAVFAYQQYKVRQTEHSLLFEPQILLTSGDISTTGSTRDRLFIDNRPFQIKWTVFIQNTSQIPLLIDLMLVTVKLDEKDSKRQTWLTPTYCHIAEPEKLSIPFEVSLTKSQNITWVIDGSAGDAFDYVSGDSNKRDFILIFEVYAKRAKYQEEYILHKEVFSHSIQVPQNANWVSKTPFLDKYRKEQEGNKTV